MDNLKEIYLRLLILIDDISTFHNGLNDEKDPTKKLRLFKNCLVALDIFRDSYKCFSPLIKDRPELIELGRNIKKQLLFINHLRNKISGHLDQKLLEKAVEWEPHIFSLELKFKRDAQLLLTYKTLLESGINSYLDENSQQKIFKTEIDLFYPPNTTLFFNYIGELNTNSIIFLSSLIEIVENQIEFWDKDKMYDMALKAAKTKFDLKNNQSVACL